MSMIANMLGPVPLPVLVNEASGEANLETSDATKWFEPITLGLAAATWGTFGPPGSGATYSDTVLENVPAGADWVLLRSQVRPVTNTTTADISVWARRTGTTGSSATNGIVQSAEDYISGGGVATHACEDTALIVVPVDHLARFDLRYLYNGTGCTWRVWCNGYGFKG